METSFVTESEVSEGGPRDSGENSSGPKRTDLGRRFYKWHRIIGLIVMIPLFLWTTSGLMHPLMVHIFKPEVANFFVRPEPVTPDKLIVDLREALERNNISDFRNFRIVSFNGATYYQVIINPDEKEVFYIDTRTGELLQNGDERYAEFLGRYFLNRQSDDISEVEYIKNYTTDYRNINRLLPVYKLSFNDRKGTDVFVETASSRYGTSNDYFRKASLWYFTNFHNWEFLEFLGPLKLGIMVLISVIIFLASVSGILVYGFYWGRYKRQRNFQSKDFWRKYHRQIGLAVSFVMFTFSFSGGYHALKKFEPDNRNDFETKARFSPEHLKTALSQLVETSSRPVANISLVRMNDKDYYQVFMAGRERTVKYLQVDDLSELNNGDELYAQYLAREFYSGGESVMNTSMITSFGGEYGFINKRLPVHKIEFDTPGNETYYIETSTGKLAAKVNDSDRKEGFSFAFLHKYHLLDFAGKVFRDIIMSISAFGILVVTVFGLIIYSRK